jgi:hypothetical protein
MSGYYIGDIKRQSEILAGMCRAINTATYPVVTIDPEKVFKRMKKRIDKHFGMLSKYDGRGRLRDE